MVIKVRRIVEEGMGSRDSNFIRNAASISLSPCKFSIHTLDSLARYHSQLNAKFTGMSPHSCLASCAAFLEVSCLGSLHSFLVTCFCLERFEDLFLLPGVLKFHDDG